MAEDQQFTEIGVSGVNLYSGQSFDEYQPSLRGMRGMRTYREMRDNDAIFGSMITALENLLRAATFSVDPADNSQEAQDMAAFVSDVFEDFDDGYTWDDVVSEAMSMLTYGFADHEVIYKRRDDGNIGLSRLGIRVQETVERYILANNNQIEALVQQPLEGGQFIIPRSKLVHWQTTNARGDPYGRSIFRNAYRAWWLKKNIEDVESIAIEREMNGLPLVRVPNQLLVDEANGDTTAKATLDAYRKIVRDLRFNSQAGVILPSDPYINTNEANLQYSNNLKVDLELVASQGTRSIDTGEVIKRYASDQARTVLSDFILLGSDTRGSYALSQSKSDLFTQSLKAHAYRFAETLNRQLLPKLFDVNGFDKELMPRVVMSQIAPMDLDTLSNYVKSLSGAGIMFTDQESNDWLRQQGGMPLEGENEPDISEQDGEEEPGAPDE